MNKLIRLTLAVLVAGCAIDSVPTADDTTPPAPGWVAGRVTVNGVHTAGITVELATVATTASGAEGMYSFRPVPPRDYTVTVQAPSGYHAVVPSRGVTVQSSMTTFADFELVSDP